VSLKIGEHRTIGVLIKNHRSLFWIFQVPYRQVYSPLHSKLKASFAGMPGEMDQSTQVDGFSVMMGNSFDQGQT
jgi:hypothetical protein